VSCRILTIPEFDKNVKKLSKRYKNLKNDLALLVVTLRENPLSGTHIFGNCYKVRLANSSVPTGKNGGFRVISYYISENSELYLLSIYSKSEQDSIKHSEIIGVLKNITK